MKIQYCSDLHIEFLENKKFLDEKPIAPIGEILIMAMVLPDTGIRAIQQPGCIFIILRIECVIYRFIIFVFPGPRNNR